MSELSRGDNCHIVFMRVLLGQLCCMVLRHGHWQGNLKKSWKGVITECWDTWREWDGRTGSPLKLWPRDVVWKWYRINRVRKGYYVWFGHVRRETEGGVLRLVEEIEVLGEKESRKTKENLERYSEEGFGTNRSGWECGIGPRKMEKDHRKSNPYFKKKYDFKWNDDTFQLSSWHLFGIQIWKPIHVVHLFVWFSLSQNF